MVQERLPPAPPAGPPRGQQVTDPGAVAGLVRVERADGGELAVHRRGRHLSRHRRQRRDLARTASRRQLEPGHELADVLQPGLAPVQAAEAEELPVVLEVVSVRLHRVRRPADVSEIGQEPVDRDDRHVVVPEHRPRSGPRTGDHHRLHEHRLLLERHGQGSRWVLAAWGSRETWGCGAAAGGHGPAFVGARCAVGAPDGAVTGSGWPVPGVMSSREQPGSGGPREPVAGVSGRRHDRGRAARDAVSPWCFVPGRQSGAGGDHAGWGTVASSTPIRFGFLPCRSPGSLVPAGIPGKARRRWPRGRRRTQT